MISETNGLDIDFITCTLTRSIYSYLPLTHEIRDASTYIYHYGYGVRNHLLAKGTSGIRPRRFCSTYRVVLAKEKPREIGDDVSGGKPNSRIVGDRPAS
jgi:hypothetical protein